MCFHVPGTKPLNMQSLFRSYINLVGQEGGASKHLTAYMAQTSSNLSRYLPQASGKILWAHVGSTSALDIAFITAISK
jgi:hypothetical protein